MITGGISCAAESRSFAPSISFHDITSSMAMVTDVATMRSQIVWKCRRDRIRFLVILCGRHQLANASSVGEGSSITSTYAVSGFCPNSNPRRYLLGWQRPQFRLRGLLNGK